MSTTSIGVYVRTAAAAEIARHRVSEIYPCDCPLCRPGKWEAGDVAAALEACGLEVPRWIRDWDKVFKTATRVLRRLAGLNGRGIIDISETRLVWFDHGYDGPEINPRVDYINECLYRAAVAAGAARLNEVEMVGCAWTYCQELEGAVT